MVELGGPQFKLASRTGEYCCGCLSLFLEIDRFASWKSMRSQSNNMAMCWPILDKVESPL